MNKFINNNKGFSVVELMVAVTVTTIILGAVLAFLMTNVKSFKATNDILDVQYEAQVALDQMSNVILSAKGISSIIVPDGTEIKNLNKYNGVDVNDIDTEVSTAIFYFEGGIKKGFKRQDNNFKYCSKVPDKAYNDIAGNITSFKMRPVGGETFASCNSVIITLIVKNNDAEVALTNQINFRNHD